MLFYFSGFALTVIIFFQVVLIFLNPFFALKKRFTFAPFYLAFLTVWACIDLLIFSYSFWNVVRNLLFLLHIFLT